MNVILLDKVENLGNIGDLVSVKAGYGRNYLLPSGKAALATPLNMAKFEARRAELEQKASAELGAAEKRADTLKGLKLEVSAKAGTEGKLFGSIGPIDIAAACEKAGVEVARSEIRLPDGPIRVAGEHPFSLHLRSDVNVDLTVTVLPEE